MPFDRFDGTLWVVGGREAAPPNALRRAKGMHRIATPSWRSRNGSVQLQALNAHSIQRFGNALVLGVSGSLYRDAVVIQTGLNGNRLRFVRMSPTGGVADYLFVANGGDLLKVDLAGAVTDWGIAPPATTPSIANLATNLKQIDSFDATTGWSSSGKSGAPAAPALETTLVQESTGSVRQQVTPEDTVTLQKDITIDLSTFGAVVSPDEDFIAFWIRVEEPRRLDSIQLQFSLGDTGFNNTFTKEIILDDNVRRAQVLTPAGIGDLAGVNGQEDAFLISNVSKPTRVRYAELLGQNATSSTDDAWTRILIPKISFVRSGLGTWADIRAVRWRFRNPKSVATRVYLDDLTLIGGVGMQGDYKYQETFFNNVTGSESDPGPEFSINSLLRQGAAITGLATTTDAQVTHRRIYRTVGNGALKFRAAEIPIGTTTFDDTVADYDGLHSAGATTLSVNQLQLDNDKPPDTVTDAAGPHQGRMWYLDGATGQRGRVFFSPAGRAESIGGGFVDLSDDDAPLLRLFRYNSALYAHAADSLYRIDGTDTFTGRVVEGVPGLGHPESLVVTPFGVAFRDQSGLLRLFNGANAPTMAVGPIQTLLEGEAAEGLAALGGVTGAAFSADEYVVSDGTTTLAVILATGRWRPLPGFNALYFDDVFGDLLVTRAGGVERWEADGLSTDNGAAIEIEFEPAARPIDAPLDAVPQLVYVDLDTKGQLLTPVVVTATGNVTLPVIQATGRQLIEIPLFVPTLRQFWSLRLTGSVTQQVEIFSMDGEAHMAALIEPDAARQIA